MNDEERVTYFGETDARNKKLRFGIKKKDRTKHMYVIGKTGMGKSTLLESLAIQDIQNGEGIAFIDPHGKTADLLLEYVPEHRIKDVLYFAPFDLEHPISFNVLEDVGIEKRHLVVSGLMSAFKKIWVDAWSARMEYILANIMLALLEYPGSTLMGVNRMLTDKDYRKAVVDNVTDPSVRSFWLEEYAKWTEKFASEAASAIQNKVGQFVANPLVRNIIGQPKSSFDIRQLMDEKKILIINLSKGRVGEANANLLGAMLITKIYLAAMSRADLSESQLKQSSQFYLYVDEFQSFANESFADILSEARKYKLNLTIAHQYIEQMTEEVRAAVFGNVGTMVVFRVGAYDADVFQKEFAPQFTAEDIVNLQMYQMYLKLMIDGVTSTPFSAKGMTPITRPEKMYVPEIIAASREQFAIPRDKVEEEIHGWHSQKFSSGGGNGSGNGGGGKNSGGQSGGGQFGGNSGNGSSGGQNGAFGNQNRSERSERSEGRGGSMGGENRGERFDRQERPQQNRDNREVRDNRDSRDSRDERREAPREAPRDNRDNRIERSGERNIERSMERRDDRQSDRVSDRREPLREPQRDAPQDNMREPREHREPQRENPREIREQMGSISPDQDAVSLNHLREKRADEAKIKNTDKAGKPQNVLALKEALLGLIQEEKKSEPEREATPHRTEENNSRVHAAPKPDHVERKVVRKENSVENVTEHNHGSHHHKAHVNEPMTPRQQSSSQSPTPSSTPIVSSTTNEVDSSELAKILGNN